MGSPVACRRRFSRFRAKDDLTPIPAQSVRYRFTNRPAWGFQDICGGSPILRTRRGAADTIMGCTLVIQPMILQQPVAGDR